MPLAMPTWVSANGPVNSRATRAAVSKRSTPGNDFTEPGQALPAWVEPLQGNGPGGVRSRVVDRVATSTDFPPDLAGGVRDGQLHGSRGRREPLQTAPVRMDPAQIALDARTFDHEVLAASVLLRQYRNGWIRRERPSDPAGTLLPLAAVPYTAAAGSAVGDTRVLAFAMSVSKASGPGPTMAIMRKAQEKRAAGSPPFCMGRRAFSWWTEK